MIKVQIDGKEFHADLSSVRTMNELVELVKASIDPDSIIVGIELDGEELSENDWRSPLSVQGGKTLLIGTGAREEYVRQRLESSVLFIDHIGQTFIQAAEAFSAGNSIDGNSALGTAVGDLEAFVGWYETVLQAGPPSVSSRADDFRKQMFEIKEICEQIIQEQMYQSWWALGETIKNKLSPQFESLKVFLREVQLTPSDMQ